MMNVLIKIFELAVLPFMLKKKVTFARLARTDRKSSFEGHNFIGVHSRLENCEMGYGSYVSRDTHLVNVRVGRYTSIGPKVTIARGEHPTSKFVSTHPAFYSPENVVGLYYVEEQKFAEFREVEGKSVIIGSDVWIGANICILEGVRIGDGSIIGAGSIVTKDVAPYTIVAGAPARPVRKRFTDKQITDLMNLRWWEKDEEWIKRHADAFSYIEDLMKEVKYE